MGVRERRSPPWALRARRPVAHRHQTATTSSPRCSALLTTVPAGRRRSGHAAAELLLRALLHGEETTDEVLLPTEFIMRESTGPAPTS